MLNVDASTRDRCLEIVDEIARAVAPHDPLVALDRSDLAVCFSYLDNADLAERCLDAAVAAVPRHDRLALWGGVAGTGWAVAHLTDPDETVDSIDAVIATALHRETWPDRCDVISGLAGFAVYAFERLAQSPGASAPRAILERVLHHLEQLAEPRDTGIAWFSPPALLPAWQRALHPAGFDDLGLAHGIAGTIAILARYLEHAVEPRRARSLLVGAVRYLLAWPASTPDGRFPSWSAETRPARVGWCYGDLGIALALARAGLACDEPAWTREGVALATAAARREVTGVVDAGICHGAAGITHLLHRLARATGDDGLHDEASRWLGRTLAMRDETQPLAGFPEIWIEDGQRIPRPSAGVLEGAAGVALVLSAAVDAQIEPAWDRLLLVDLPAR